MKKDKPDAFNDAERDSPDYPKVDFRVLFEYINNNLNGNQSRLISELVVKSREWADAFRELLKESAQG